MENYIRKVASNQAPFGFSGFFLERETVLFNPFINQKDFTRRQFVTFKPTTRRPNPKHATIKFSEPSLCPFHFCNLLSSMFQILVFKYAVFNDLFKFMLAIFHNIYIEIE